MTANQYEHYMVFVEEVNNNGEMQMGLTAVAVDLSPDSQVTMRQLNSDEVGESLSDYVDKARGSMDQVCDRMVEQVINAYSQNNGDLPHFGYIDLSEQFQAAPHLLLANMLAAMVASCAQAAIESPVNPLSV